MSVIRVIMVRIFPHLDWIRRDTEYLSVFSPNARKYRPETTPYLDNFHAVITTRQWMIHTVFKNSEGVVTTCNFIKKEALAQVLSWEFWEIFKNIFFIEHFPATALGNWMILVKKATSSLAVSFDQAITITLFNCISYMYSLGKQFWIYFFFIRKIFS